MIGAVIAWSIRNRFLVLLLTVALIAASSWGVYHLSVDAIPDLSDVQVILVTEAPGQNPEVIDKQITYPLSTAMLSVPKAKVVRGSSMFGLSFVYVIFEDGTDIYWARSRVLEYLNFARDRLPKGVEPKLGPDATGVGWVYQYVLYPGYYSPDHPKGLFLDAAHEGAAEHWYGARGDAPADRRESLVRVRAWEEPGEDPLTHQALVSANQDLGQLRSLQDWYMRYPLQSVEGVSEVASIGGFVKQYQIILDPDELKAYSIPLKDVITAVQRSNNDVGGATVEMSENEYMVRSRGYLRGAGDIENVPVGMGDKGTPILLKDVARVQIGGEMRRGVGEYDGQGELAGGVVVARFGANAFEVIHDVKAKLASLETGLPPGVMIEPTYDRSALIERSIETLRRTLIEEITVVGLVCILFLLHARSELVAVFVVPASVLVSLLLMQLLGINANIMSLGGIAIAIGVVVDSAIVMVENAHKHLDREEDRLRENLKLKTQNAKRETQNSRLETQDARLEIQNARPRQEIILEAAKEVGPSLFFSLLVITVSFLPVFVLGGESGRLFKPLALTKTFAMGAAAVLSITIIPVLMYYFITSRVLPKSWGRVNNTLITLSTMLIPAAVLWLVGDLVPALKAWQWWMAGGWAVLAGMLLIPQKIIHEKHSPISWVLQRIYNPFFSGAMHLRWLVIAVAVVALASTLYPIMHMGTEFMPRLDEGDLLYMPTTDPSVSVTKAKEILQQTDKLIGTFPEVESVHGKVGRADTATDPAPMSMIETVVQLEPDRSKWRHREVRYFFSDWPGWAKWPLTHFWPENRPITMEELRSGWEDQDGVRHPGLDDVVKLPGVGNAWPYPIENRLNMLATGMKTPVGIKIFGPDLETLGQLQDEVAAAVTPIKGTLSAYPERTEGGLYLDIEPIDSEIARYGLTRGDVQDVIETAIGGMNITTTVEGPARYPLNMRFAHHLRDNLPALKELLVPTPRAPGAGGGANAAGAAIPLGQLATFKISPGPSMIRSENGQLSAWVYVDVDQGARDLGSYVAEARRVVEEKVALPAGYQILWSGQFQYWEETLPRLVAATVVTVVLIIFLLYMGTASWFRVGVVLMALPFSLIGACWFTYLLGYHFSLAVGIGMIALAGLDAETGLVMLLYLDNSFERFVREGRMRNRADLWEAVHDGAVKRIRPKAMTVAAAFIGLVPLLWADGSGADVMRRLAAPLIGGLIVSFLMELLIYPIVFYIAKGIGLRGEVDAGPGAVAEMEVADAVSP